MREERDPGEEGVDAKGDLGRILLVVTADPEEVSRGITADDTGRDEDELVAVDTGCCFRGGPGFEDDERLGTKLEEGRADGFGRTGAPPGTGGSGFEGGAFLGRKLGGGGLAISGPDEAEVDEDEEPLAPDGGCVEEVAGPDGEAGANDGDERDELAFGRRRPCVPRVGADFTEAKETGLLCGPCPGERVKGEEACGDADGDEDAGEPGRWRSGLL